MSANEHRPLKRTLRKRRRLFVGSSSVSPPVCSHHVLIDLTIRYGDSPQQLSAARVRIAIFTIRMRLILSTQLWAIMLRNSSELFVHQCAKSKFLDTLDDVLGSHRTSPVVRERLLDVLAAAAYASTGPSHKTESSFRLLWKKVKPAGKPDEVCLYTCMQTNSNTKTFCRACPSIPTMPCLTLPHHGEAPRPLFLLVISLPCTYKYFKPQRRRPLSLKYHRPRYLHNRYHPNTRLRHHNCLAGQNARRLVLVNYSVLYRLKRTCGDCFKNAALRMGMHNYYLKRSHSPLQKTYEIRRSSR